MTADKFPDERPNLQWLFETRKMCDPGHADELGTRNGLSHRPRFGNRKGSILLAGHDASGGSDGREQCGLTRPARHHAVDRVGHGCGIKSIQATRYVVGELGLLTLGCGSEEGFDRARIERSRNLAAYSDDVAQSFRLDVAHRPDLMSPSVPG